MSEPVSVFDVFKVGVGPSSSHTLGPWRAASTFWDRIEQAGLANRVEGVQVDLYGSLAKTGRGHGTDFAVMMGLSGIDPATCDPDQLGPLTQRIRETCRIALGNHYEVPFDPRSQIRFHRDQSLPGHPNALRLSAKGLEVSRTETYFSVGGGFIVRDSEGGGVDDSSSMLLHENGADLSTTRLPYPFEEAGELAEQCARTGFTMPELMWANERTWRVDAAIYDGAVAIWRVMLACAYRGCHVEGTLPGGLGVARRAASMSGTLLHGRRFEAPDAWLAALADTPRAFDEVLRVVSCVALAVNEENAAFGRVVTAPTNGAAGVIPAVLVYALCFCDTHHDDTTTVVDFLLSASAIAMLFQRRATISAAMGGCQAEIGVSSAMAAAGLTVVRGGSTAQALMAAEIAMEHHLGLTCDPIGGLVQVPCIERNAMGAAKAITASHLALAGDPDRAKVSLDAAIRTMWATALDMSNKYKETSEGGLAVEIPVNVIEC